MSALNLIALFKWKVLFESFGFLIVQSIFVSHLYKPINKPNFLGRQYFQCADGRSGQSNYLAIYVNNELLFVLVDKIGLKKGCHFKTHAFESVRYCLVDDYDFDPLKLAAPEGGFDVSIVYPTKRCRG